MNDRPFWERKKLRISNFAILVGVRHALYLFLFYILFGNVAINAQAPQFSIFDNLERPSKSSEGMVVIHQSDAIKRLVGTRIDSENLNVVNGKTYIITRGYRIQVYSGNNQRTSKDEAASFQAKIKGRFPGLESETKFDAPFWKLHVGNFLTFEEASIMRRELQKVFPQQKNEIYIIEDDIRLSLD